ncbi:choice-of-anchor M domain-containing protein [Allonocardiopsis opalescens]|uniref:Surface-anchored protein n=1 Tax=Allonocardiopsis opalescens TaxID=1144618 RepID=A0A2T0Q2C7_9ACTN|nr:choice-of-anchor M domain-containing protein [Allonocardiopsis opalescens]PRX97952.1 surface-anchored protein [Allonocardiopsis opalescens]
MNPRRSALLTTGAAATALLLGAAPATAQVVLSEGHVDVVEVEFHVDHFHVHVHDDASGELDPSEVLLHVVPAAETAVPADPAYAFLGEPGDPVWILPQSQQPGVLFAGWSTEPVEPGVFQDEELRFELLDVSGPGDFSVFDTTAAGTPDIRFDSGDGTGDVTTVPVGTHEHTNWAFEAEGDYTVTLEVSGVLLDGTEVSTGPIDYSFTVGALS